MRYKQYEAAIEYDEHDQLFVGQVIDIKDIIVFDGRSLEELEQSFHAVIDEYLLDCQVLYKDPQKPYVIQES
jgi:predicted HicB family RNase H-like nuclease